MCPGAVGIGNVRFGWLGLVSNGSFRYCRVSYAVVRFGWRVMVRLVAVLCGTVMYGLVWLERYGTERRGALGRGMVWCGMAGEAGFGGVRRGLLWLAEVR